MLLLPNHTCDLTNEWQKQLLVLFEYFLRSSCTHVPTCASVPPPLQNLYVSKRIKVVEKGQHQLTLILFATLFFLRKLHLYFLYILSNIFGLSLFFTCSLAFSISMAEAKLRLVLLHFRQGSFLHTIVSHANMCPFLCNECLHDLF